MLFGSDAAISTARAPRQAWAAFKNLTPLTPEELETIAKNLPPYAK